MPQTDTNKCLESAVAQFGSRVKSARSYLVKGHWAHVPSGCTVYTGGKRKRGEKRRERGGEMGREAGGAGGGVGEWGNIRRQGDKTWIEYG